MKKIKRLLRVLITSILVVAISGLGSMAVFAAASASVRENVPYDGVELYELDGKPAYCAERRKETDVDTLAGGYQLIGTDAAAYENDSQKKDEKEWWRDDQTIGIN